MNAICGMVKVLKGSAMQPEQQECVQIISSSAKALLSLLNNILDFSKAEAGKAELVVPRCIFAQLPQRHHNAHSPIIQEVPFDLRKFIKKLTLLMSNQMSKRPMVTLSHDIAPK